MADESKDKAEAKPAAKPKPALPLHLLIPAGAGLVAAALGIALGLLVVGPRVVALRPGAPAANAEPGGGHEGGHGGKGKEGAKAAVFRLDNLIVNPAGSGGTRFLLASVAIEVPDDRYQARLRDRDFQVRDAVIAVLERQTLESVTSPGARDSIKVRLGQALAPMIGAGVPVQVYLPQFVLQ
jgi:flagellar protein FliL